MKLKKLLTRIGFVTLAGTALSMANPASAFAAGSSSGLVTAVDVESGRVMFKAGTHNGYPACATTSKNQSDEWGTWSFTLSAPDGPAKLSLLLFARGNGLQVNVGGNGLCDSWGDRETASIIRIKP